MESVSAALLKYEHLTTDDLNDDYSLLKKISGLLDSIEFKFIVSYEDNLIDEAKKYKMNCNSEMALLLYSTFFEHKLNDIIITISEKKKYNLNTITEVVKNVNMHGKTSWLLVLLDLPKLNINHAKAIITAANYRNAFVHYKYKWEHEDKKAKEDENKQNFLNTLDKTVSYIKRYSTKVSYDNQKGQLDKQIKIVHAKRRKNTK